MTAWDDMVLPDRLFYAGFKPRSYRDNLPDLFKVINSIPAVSERMRALLAGIRLGEGTRFHEAPLFEVDQTARRPERLWLLKVATAREAMLPEASHGLEGPLIGGRYETAAVAMPAPDLAVDPSACADVDLWVDPQLRGSLFVSAALKRAITDAKMKARYLHWSPCRAA